MRGNPNAGSPISAFPADVQHLIGRKLAENRGQDVTITDVVYRSMVRFAGTHAAGPPVTKTFAVQTALAFSYGIGAAMTAAGFATGTATPAETNLKTGNETNDNSDYIFWGLAIQPSPLAEPSVLAQLFRNCTVGVVLGGNTVPIGKIDDFPGAGGINGAGRSFLKRPPFEATGAGTGTGENGTGGIIGFCTNGVPLSGNYKRLYQAFVWSRRGQAGADTQVNIAIKLETAFTETAGLARTGVDAGTANMVAGTFVPPADGALGSFVDFDVKLIGCQIGPRSRNA